MIPLDVAAVQRQRDALRHQPCAGRGCVDAKGEPTCDGLIEGGSATLAQVLDDVLTLAAALETAERERDAARSAHAELAAAVREERDAVDDACIARGSEDAGLDVAFAVAEREDDAARAVDALLAGAPPPATVPAALVRRQIGAVLAANGCDCDCDHSSDEHDDDCDRCLACRVEGALDAALAGCGQ